MSGLSHWVRIHWSRLRDLMRLIFVVGVSLFLLVFVGAILLARFRTLRADRPRRDCFQLFSPRGLVATSSDFGLW